MIRDRIPFVFGIVRDLLRFDAAISINAQDSF